MSPSSPRPSAPRGGPSAAQGGFVLIEILIALVIFASIVLAYAKGTDNALEAASQANSDRTLRMLTSRKLAEIHAKPFEVRDGGEGGFDEEVTPGEESPFADYRWAVEAKEVVVAGYSAANDAEFLFERDREGGTPTTSDGSKAPDPVTLLRLTLVVSRIPDGDEEGERMRIVTYVPTPKDETATGGTR